MGKPRRDDVLEIAWLAGVKVCTAAWKWCFSIFIFCYTNNIKFHRALATHQAHSLHVLTHPALSGLAPEVETFIVLVLQMGHCGPSGTAGR